MNVKPGQLVWVEVADFNGFRKVRPVVVISTSSDPPSSTRVTAVAIATKIPAKLPDDQVLLPWAAEGRCHSGLRRRSAAVCSWIVTFFNTDIRGWIGTLNEETLRQIMGKIPPNPTSATI